MHTFVYRCRSQAAFVASTVLLISAGLTPVRSRKADSESGQASVEYALVLLGAAVVASLLIAWASKTKLIDDLFEHVMNLIKGKAA
jgi:Flp pilus assembly pilin Flp